MPEQPIIITPVLEDVYVVPVELADPSASMILDEYGQPLRDENGLPLYEE